MPAVYYPATGGLSRDDADRRSRAAMRSLCRERGAVWVDGKGMAPGKPVGPGRAARVDIGYATHAVPVRETVTPGEFLIEVTPEMEALPAGNERIDGRDVPVARSGVDRGKGVFPERPDVANRGRARP